MAAIDFSEESSAALRCAQELARLQHAMLLLIHVIDPVGYAFPAGAPPAVDHDKAAREELARIETEVRKQGIPVHSRVETGIVCERILLSLRDHKAALLVLGTKAITGAGRAALGLVTRQLLAHSPCPILTVAPENPKRPRNFGQWNNVLAATDFSAGVAERAALCAEGGGRTPDRAALDTLRAASGLPQLPGAAAFPRSVRRIAHDSSGPFGDGRRSGRDDRGGKRNSCGRT